MPLPTSFAGLGRTAKEIGGKVCSSGRTRLASMKENMTQKTFTTELEALAEYVTLGGQYADHMKNLERLLAELITLLSPRTQVQTIAPEMHTPTQNEN